MKDNLFKKLKAFDNRIEFSSGFIALTGIVFYLIGKESFYSFLIIGCVTLTILYVLRFFTPNRLENIFSAMETFIDKVVHGSLAAAIIGIMMVLLGKEGVVFLTVGIFSIVLVLFLMIYNKIKLKSKYVWGQKYFLRIAIIIGLAIILFLKVKGIIVLDF